MPITLTAGSNLIEINTDRLASATYFLVVEGEGWETKPKKFVKVNE